MKKSSAMFTAPTVTVCGPNAAGGGMNRVAPPTPFDASVARLSVSRSNWLFPLVSWNTRGRTLALAVPELIVNRTLPSLGTVTQFTYVPPMVTPFHARERRAGHEIGHVVATRAISVAEGAITGVCVRVDERQVDAAGETGIGGASGVFTVTCQKTPKSSIHCAPLDERADVELVGAGRLWGLDLELEPGDLIRSDVVGGLCGDAVVTRPACRRRPV